MKKIVIWGILLMLILISGCSKSEYRDEWGENPYCREHVNFLSKSSSFGLGRSEDMNVALKYIYDSDEIAEIYGNTFQLTGDSVICCKSESHSFLFSWLYRGKAVCEIVLENESYVVSLSKDYFGKWTVNNCEKRESDSNYWF